jgi:hypothetical protein
VDVTEVKLQRANRKIYGEMNFWKIKEQAKRKREFFLFHFFFLLCI